MSSPSKRSIACPSCKALLSVAQVSERKKLCCPKCRHAFVVSAPHVDEDAELSKAIADFVQSSATNSVGYFSDEPEAPAKSAEASSRHRPPPAPSKSQGARRTPAPLRFVGYVGLVGGVSVYVTCLVIASICLLSEEDRWLGTIAAMALFLFCIGGEVFLPKWIPASAFPPASPALDGECGGLLRRPFTILFSCLFLPIYVLLFLTMYRPLVFILAPGLLVLAVVGEIVSWLEGNRIGRMPWCSRCSIPLVVVIALWAGMRERQVAPFLPELPRYQQLCDDAQKKFNADWTARPIGRKKPRDAVLKGKVIVVSPLQAHAPSRTTFKIDEEIFLHYRRAYALITRTKSAPWLFTIPIKQ